MKISSMTTTSPDTLKNWFFILLGTSFITILVHGYLSMHGYNLQLGLDAGQSLCNVSATFNCDSAAVSRYAHFFGIPMAILGLITQLALLVFLLSCQWGLSQYSDVVRRLIFWLSLFVAGTSLVMAQISIFALGTFCPFCVATYVLSLFSLFAAYRYQINRPWTHLSSDLALLFSSVRWPLVILLMIPTLGYMSNAIILDSYGFGKMEQIIGDSLSEWEQSPTYNFKLDQGLALGNSSNPKMTIVEFADFLCPHCRVAYPVLHAFVKSHPDAQLIFKSFPLDAKCNKSLTHEGDGHRCKLSSSVFCAGKLFNKGWEFHHWLFDHQEGLGAVDQFPNSLEQMSRLNQVSADAIKKCLDEDLTTEAIQAMGLEGANAKVQGTPSVFVNGKALPRGQFLPVLEALYQKLHP